MGYIEILEDASFRVILKHWASKWQYLPFFLSWPGGWKRGDNRIRRHWFWNGELKQRLHTSTRVSLPVFLCLDYWILQIYQGRAQNRRTYTPQGWCLGLTMVLNNGHLKVFLIKKLCVYLFTVKQCIYLVIHMCFMQIYFHLLWFSPFIYRICCISEFFIDLTCNVDCKGKRNSKKIQGVK